MGVEWEDETGSEGGGEGEAGEWGCMRKGVVKVREQVMAEGLLEDFDEEADKKEAEADRLKRERCARVDLEGLVSGRETVFVNASVMDVGYRPVNAPWVVDVELPLGNGRRESRTH